MLCKTWHSSRHAHHTNRVGMQQLVAPSNLRIRREALSSKANKAVHPPLETYQVDNNQLVLPLNNPPSSHKMSHR